MRFGLLNLLIAVVFLSGLLGCWVLRDPWVELTPIPSVNAPIVDSTFSSDGKFILAVDGKYIVRAYSYPQFKLLGEYTSPLKEFTFAGFVGKPAFAIHIIHNGAMFSRVASRFHYVFDWEQKKEITLNDARERAEHPYLFDRANSDGLTLYLVGDRKTINGTVYYLRFPEFAWTGHFYRPEVWVTILAGLALIVQFIRYRKLAQARA